MTLDEVINNVSFYTIIYKVLFRWEK